MKQRAGRFIDPLSDFGFKHLFGNEPNKDILIDFLNQLFKGEKEISDVAYSPTEHGGDNEDTKKVFFDLMCTGQNGEQFLIEMQRGNQHNFKDRAVFYTSRLINDQLPRGRKNWNTGLKEVYLIGILDFNLKKIAELSNLTKEEKDMYDSGLKAKWDYENTIAYAKDMAKEEGLEEGLEKGVEIGEHKKALEIAREMKEQNASADQISKLTKLPVAEIEAL